MNSQRKTQNVLIGSVGIGGDNPIRIQSMTNTPTDDVESTVMQTIELAEAGSEIVRITVNTPEAAKAVVEIRKQLDQKGCAHLPLVGDFHYNGHLLLGRYPECAAALDKYRINPGNVGKGDQRAEHFSQIIRIALENKKPVRIGVNWGSLDQDLLTQLMDENSKSNSPLSDKEVIIEAMITSAIDSAQLAEDLGMPENKIILSVKMSEIPDMTRAYTQLDKRLLDLGKGYPLHLGLTEAGYGAKGLVASSAALAILLDKGIGDTIRISLTPSPSSKRSDEVEACQLLLQTMGIRSFKPLVTSCPGCGRTSNNLYQKMAEDITEYIDERIPTWSQEYPGVEEMKVAVMGCIVNGPGESQHADIGISLPGKSESPMAQVYRNGELFRTLKGENVIQDFKELMEEHVKENYS